MENILIKSRSLCQNFTDEPALTSNGNLVICLLTALNLIEKSTVNGYTQEVKVAIPYKYLGNF